MTIETKFIGEDLAAEWAKRPGLLTIGPYQTPVRVFLADGSEHVFPQWEHSHREDDDGDSQQNTNGGHHYALSGTGELLIVVHSSTVHFSEGAARKILKRERVAVTYNASAWLRVTGPIGQAPSEPKEERIGS